MVMAASFLPARPDCLFVKFLYAFGCVAAVGFATHFPRRQRYAAMLMACGLLTVWVAVEWTYSGYSPKVIIHALTGVSIVSTDLWPPLDAAFGIAAIALGRRTWWGVALWALATLQCCFHVAFSLGAMDVTVYLSVLDKSLVCEIAVFLVGGYRGVSDRCSSYLGGRAGNGALRGAVAGSSYSRQVR